MEVDSGRGYVLNDLGCRQRTDESRNGSYCQHFLCQKQFLHKHVTWSGELSNETDRESGLE